MVIWILGLSGSGKTLLSKKIKNKINSYKKFITIDGDQFRKHFSNDLGYSYNERKKNAERISKLVKFLNDNKINLIVSVLSNFPKWLNWNRKHIDNYFEIYIKVNKKILFIRNKKKLYKSKKKNVVGKDIKFNEPKKPDLVFKNDFKKKKLDIFLNKVVAIIKSKNLK
tara:strand:- start:8850 stop:9353 length:504 start_codon:yes stop_codon:yes gene_type:complete